MEYEGEGKVKKVARIRTISAGINTFQNDLFRIDWNLAFELRILTSTTNF
jgi:hypothetical protein